MKTITSGIYLITNLINGHIYIGQSSHIQRRFRTYRSLAIRQIEHPETLGLIYQKLRQYGISNFKFEIIKETYDLDYWEKFFIFWYDSHFFNGHGYNKTFGGDGGHIVSEETREKNRKAALGNTHNKGNKYSKEVCERISRIKKEQFKNGLKPASFNKSPSEESRKKMSEAKKGKPPHNKGKSMSNEQKEKLRLANLGKRRYTNGIINVLCRECPPGFILGTCKS